MVSDVERYLVAYSCICRYERQLLLITDRKRRWSLFSGGSVGVLLHVLLISGRTGISFLFCFFGSRLLYLLFGSIFGFLFFGIHPLESTRFLGKHCFLLLFFLFLEYLGIIVLRMLQLRLRLRLRLRYDMIYIMTKIWIPFNISFPVCCLGLEQSERTFEGLKDPLLVQLKLLFLRSDQLRAPCCSDRSVAIQTSTLSFVFSRSPVVGISCSCVSNRTPSSPL